MVATALVASGCTDPTSPVGDPDPGHHIMDALAPVLTVLPSGVEATTAKKYAPQWDSCDGRDDTYGWDDVTVDLDWPYTGGDTGVRSHVRNRMRQLGWTQDTPPTSTEPTWTKQLDGGGEASAMLLGGTGSDPTSWMLQATAPPATHPVRGC